MSSPSSQNHRRRLKLPPPDAAFESASAANAVASTMPSTEYQTRLGRHVKREAIASGLTDFAQRRLQIRNMAFLFHIDKCCSPSIWMLYRVKSTPAVRASRSFRTFSLI